MASILVRAAMTDGCELDGALDAPRGEKSLALDGVCMIHGTGANFYGSRLLGNLVDGFVDRGVMALRANTRGHDGINTVVSPKGGLRQGAAFEVVDDCRHDLAGWTKQLRLWAGERVILLGHSLGAVKCLYAACHVADLKPAGVIAISPPRLSYSWFCQSPKATEFLELFRLAELSPPLSLIEVKIPLPMWISAAGYVEKYGPQERYNFLNFAKSVPCPTLFTFGSKEVAGNVAFAELPEEVAKWKVRGAPVDVRVIADADHVYTGRRAELWSAIDGWLGETFAE